MAIVVYSIVSHWWLFQCKPLVVINGYFQSLYYKLLLVIICYITTIDDYCNFKKIHVLLFYILNYFTLCHFILDYFKLLNLG